MERKDLAHNRADTNRTLAVSATLILSLIGLAYVLPVYANNDPSCQPMSAQETPKWQGSPT